MHRADQRRDHQDRHVGPGIPDGVQKGMHGRDESPLPHDVLIHQIDPELEADPVTGQPRQQPRHEPVHLALGGEAEGDQGQAQGPRRHRRPGLRRAIGVHAMADGAAVMRPDRLQVRVRGRRGTVIDPQGPDLHRGSLGQPQLEGRRSARQVVEHQGLHGAGLQDHLRRGCLIVDTGRGAFRQRPSTMQHPVDEKIKGHRAPDAAGVAHARGGHIQFQPAGVADKAQADAGGHAAHQVQDRVRGPGQSPVRKPPDSQAGAVGAGLHGTRHAEHIRRAGHLAHQVTIASPAMCAPQDRPPRIGRQAPETLSPQGQLGDLPAIVIKNLYEPVSDRKYVAPF